MASRSSVGPKAINVQGFEPSLGSAALLTSTSNTNGTVAVTGGAVYRLSNATSTVVYAGFDTVYNSGVVGTAVSVALVSGFQDVVIPATKSVLHYTGGGVLNIVLHAE